MWAWLWAWLRQHTPSETPSERDVYDEVRKYDDPTATLYDSRSDAPSVLVITSDADGGVPHIIRSDDSTGKGITIVDAARAASTTPTYLPVHKLEEDDYYFDNESGYNNTAMLVIDEAQRKYGYGVRFFPLLSVGTGIPGRRGKFMNKSYWDSNRTHRKLWGMFSRGDMGMDIPGIGDVNPSDHKAIGKIIRKTNRFLNSNEGKACIRDVVEALQYGRAIEDSPKSRRRLMNVRPSLEFRYAKSTGHAQPPSESHQLDPKGPAP